MVGLKELSEFKTKLSRVVSETHTPEYGHYHAAVYSILKNLLSRCEDTCGMEAEEILRRLFIIVNDIVMGRIETQTDEEEPSPEKPTVKLEKVEECEGISDSNIHAKKKEAGGAPKKVEASKTRRKIFRGNIQC